MCSHPTKESAQFYFTSHYQPALLPRALPDKALLLLETCHTVSVRNLADIPLVGEAIIR